MKLSTEWTPYQPYAGPPPPYGSAFDGKVLRTRVRVYYEDTDFSGVVYHATYLRYAERARSDFLRLLGVSNRMLMEMPEPMTFVVARFEMDFLRVAKIDDELDIATRMESFRGARSVFAQRIGGAQGEVWRARLIAATISVASNAPRRLPPELAQRMAALAPDPDATK